MPISKDALKRYRIIDKLLSNPNYTYTTEEIHNAVRRECGNISLRMIQKDIKSIEEEFGKKIIRNAGKRGCVKYTDQSEPLFYQQLTEGEEEILREALKSLGQFEGLDNFTWLDLLKKKLDYQDNTERPIISFSKNEGLQIPPKLLGKLFCAISEKKVIKVKYTPFNQLTKTWTIHPYQLKQYNDRWFLLCAIKTDKDPFDPSFILDLSLDRLSDDIEYVEDIEYIETPVDLKSRYEEIVGVTFHKENTIEDIFFAVDQKSVEYVRTKWIHTTQIELTPEYQEFYRKKYPSLNNKIFFSISCRENYELKSRFASYGERIIIVEPESLRKQMKKFMNEAAEIYNNL